MYRAEVDQEHNRLILCWVGSLNTSEVDRLQAEITSLLPQLRSGFDGSRTIVSRPEKPGGTRWHEN
jgi:hypothetical protein